MLTCYLNTLLKITWLVSETMGRYSQPLVCFCSEYFCQPYCANLPRAYLWLWLLLALRLTVLYSLRGWSQIWNKHIILHLLWSHLACPYECAALLFSVIECPELLLTYYDLKEWDFFVNNNTEKAKLISSSQEVSECLINTGWSE